MRAVEKNRYRQHKARYQPLKGLGAVSLYIPTGEEARKLVYLGLKDTYDSALQYITDVENGVIARGTGQKVWDIGDFEVFMNGYSLVKSSCVLVLTGSPYWSFYIGHKPTAGGDSGTFYIPAKRASYIQIRAAGLSYDTPYSFSQSLVNALTDDTWDRPAQTYTQQAVANTYQLTNNTNQLYVDLAATNAATLAQIEADKKAFELQAQNQANILEAARQKELADEQLRMIQDEMARLTRINEEADNTADSIYEMQRLEQERLRQAQLAAQAAEAQRIATANAAALAIQEAEMQKRATAAATAAKQTQITTTAKTGATTQAKVTTTAKTTLAPTTAKPTTTASTGTKPSTSTSAARTEEGTDTPPEDPNSPDAKKGLPIWAWVAIGVVGLAGLGGGAYYMNQKGKGKGKAKDKKAGKDKPKKNK